MRGPFWLWSAADAAAADAHTMRQLGVPSAVLMERASLCVARVVAERSQGCPVVALVGPGNNGADGLAVTRILTGWGLDASAWAVTDRRNDAAEQQLVLARSHGVRVRSTPDDFDQPALWLDGLLGTGARGEPTGAVADALAWVEGRPGPRVAIDVPTGVHVDSGQVGGAAFRADVTVTFARSKPGLHITPGRNHAGDVVVADMGILGGESPRRSAWIATAAWVAERLAERRDPAHKGHRGHVAVLGGSGATPGAAVLAGTAALRGGAGLCTWVLESTPGAAGLARPELMTAPWQSPVLPAADVLVVGPGLTALPDAGVLESLYRDDPRAAVWDASALDSIPLGIAPAGPRVITPHPGEAARLMNRIESVSEWTSATVQAQRRRVVQALCDATGAVAVLKGAGTVVAGFRGLGVVLEGSAALATAGTGDVLAGLIGALIARGVGVESAASVGASVHGLAGDIAAERVGVPLATDVADAIPEALAQLEQGRGSAARQPSFVRG